MNKETTDLVDKSKLVVDRLVENGYDTQGTIDQKLDVFFDVLTKCFPETPTTLFPTVRMYLNSENEKDSDFYEKERQVIIEKIRKFVSEGYSYEECIAGCFKGQQEMYKSSGLSGKLVLLGLIKMDSIIIVFKK